MLAFLLNRVIISHKPTAYLLSTAGLMMSLFTINSLHSALAQDKVLPALAQSGQSSDNPIHVAVAWSPDGKMLAVGTTASIWLYSDKFQPITYFRQEDKDVSSTLYASSLSWSADSSKLVGNSGKRAYLWDVRKRQIISTYTPPEHHFGPNVICPDGNAVVTTDTSGKVWVWDVATGKDLTTLIDRGYGPTVNLIWNKDCSHLILGGAATGKTGTTIQTWSLLPQRMNLQFGGRDIETALALSSDGTTLICGYYYHDSAPETVVAWDVATGKQLFALDDDPLGVTAIVWSPDGQRFATNDNEGNLIIWDFRSRKIITKLQGGYMEYFYNFPNALAWSPDGSKLVSASTDNVVRVYDMRTYKLLTILTGDGSF